MEASWLHNCGRKKLIIFCNGWGMDGFPFQSLMSVEYDVYMLYDYRQIDIYPDIDAVLKMYEEVHLVSWSMGVWVGQKLFTGKQHLFGRTIAINGTLCPIDDSFGIPVQIFNGTLADFGEAARLKFYKRMCREKENLKLFLAQQPQRSFKDQGEELAALKKSVDCIPVKESIYKEIIISDCDLIVPSVNQINYWQGRLVRPVSGFHFIFNLWQSWDQLLDFSDTVPNK
ncbi:MAG: DUF452 family protein [Desulfobulbaceae bacterium]|nr:DUF452 family protein [Desulfobulbaceae bacterium]